MVDVQETCPPDDRTAEGLPRVPVTEVAAQLGHSRNSLTLDTYSHVLIDERSANRS
jgi:hypothetical protein